MTSEAEGRPTLHMPPTAHVRARQLDGEPIAPVTAPGAGPISRQFGGGQQVSPFKTCQFIAKSAKPLTDADKCGAPTAPGRAYCEEHCRRCYSVPSQVRNPQNPSAVFFAPSFGPKKRHYDWASDDVEIDDAAPQPATATRKFNPAEATRLHLQEGISFSKLAARYGVAKSTVVKAVQRATKDPRGDGRSKARTVTPQLAGGAT